MISVYQEGERDCGERKRERDCEERYIAKREREREREVHCGERKRERDEEIFPSNTPNVSKAQSKLISHIINKLSAENENIKYIYFYRMLFNYKLVHLYMH